ncbi:MAG TPA: CTP synthase, partial [Blastocatellia bacterium]|nr:CTP synthase [Blastocatellia bacterium]
AYKDRLAEAGLVFSGKSPDGKFIEMIELADHPWFLGTQAHPELKSKPLSPHPLFASFIRAAYNHRLRDQVDQGDGEEQIKAEVAAAN